MFYKSVRLSFCILLCFFMSQVSAEELSPETVSGAKTVDAIESKALFDQGALFVDVRRTNEYEEARIPGAVGLELKNNFTPESLAAELGKDEAVVFYCNGPKCLRSSAASKKAVEWGFSKVYYFRDGMPAWQAAGMPIE